MKRINPSCMRTIVLLLTGAALMLTMSTAGADSFRIRNCPGTALTDLNWAADFIDNHLNALLSSSALNSADQVRIREHWGGTTIKCRNNNYCARNPGTGGYHISANRIHLCWNNLLALSGINRCRLVGIIMHEKAHEAHVPKADQHNDRHNYAFEVNIDPVYRFGNAAAAYCRSNAGAAGLVALGTTGTLAIGDHCDRNAQCRSGQCRWGECVCDDDNDCPGDRICNKVGRNRCVQAQLSLGVACDINAQCRSGQCRGGNCVCNDDGDCPADHRCKTAGKNECIRIGGQIGEVCNRNSDCLTGQCDRDVCVCATNAHCQSLFGPNMRCRKVGQNHCQRTNQPAGSRCYKDGDCSSDNCKGIGSRRTCR